MTTALLTSECLELASIGVWSSHCLFTFFSSFTLLHLFFYLNLGGHAAAILSLHPIMGGKDLLSAFWGNLAGWEGHGGSSLFVFLTLQTKLIAAVITLGIIKLRAWVLAMMGSVCTCLVCVSTKLPHLSTVHSELTGKTRTVMAWGAQYALTVKGWRYLSFKQ